MDLKRKFFNECIGDPRLQKALSLAICLKNQVGKTSVIRDWSVNKLHLITGASPTTIRKYLPILKSRGWVHFSGKRRQHLVVGRISSHTAHRNICINEFKFDSFKDIFNSLRAFLALALQARKDFIRQTLQTYRNPFNHKEFVKARKTLKRLVKRGVLSGMDARYKEYGLSLKRIAQETGNCIRTAQTTIKHAIGMGWCKKQHHPEAYYLKGISFRDTGEFFTYSTKNYVVLMHANTYILSDEISKSLGMVYIVGKK